MINEDKVALMTRMASYESGRGKKDITVLNYFRGDYIGFQVLKSVIAATIAFFLVFAVYVFYNFENGIGIYNIETEKQTSIPVNKKIISIEESNDFTFLLAKKDTEYTVYIVEKTNILEGSFSFTAETAFINATDDTLYIGKDSNISSVKLQKS